jgi:hypothetical protein
VQTGSWETLNPALRHFRAVLEINSDLAEAATARQNIANIEKALANR